MADQKNTENAKSTSPSGKQDIVKPELTTDPPSDTTPQNLQDIVKPK